eukprot:Seg1085.9 transcript_id=Seg1085.9/GoldUCD/mRNA.D3Y31 product="LIX1-like protein" protein_id=Seg1085.9/GoldUCD/D3Y31
MMLRKAVDAVLNSFAKHTKQNGEVNVKEALHEFWHVKHAKEGFSEDLPDLKYETESQKDGLYACYVTLPGGSCLGSFEECHTKADAQKSAAKIALMNSVFNEHPSRVITEQFIEQAVAEATEISNNVHDDKGIEAFRYMLSENLGKTMLEFQEIMTIFRLLQWNGALKMFRHKRMKKKDVVLQNSRKKLDNLTRQRMANDWVAREKKTPGCISKEISKAEVELHDFRLAGRELRFFKEKRDILVLASKLLDNEC